MSFVVWNAGNPADREQWLSAWHDWAERDVFAHPSYSQLYETDSEQAVCAAWRDGGRTVLFPLLVRKIRAADDSRCCDLATPYGYGGPFVFGARSPQPDIPEFWEAYDSWRTEQCAVSEFVRFSLFPESRLGSYPGETVGRMMNVVRELDLTREELWNDFDYKVRKNVKRAQSSGMEIIHDPTGARLEEFLQIYSATMTRRHASQAYYFPAEFFRRIQSGLPGSHTFFHAMLDGKVIASELVLLSARYAYSFLGGTDERYFGNRPNDFLKAGIIEWCRESGRRAFVLGGGYKPGDGIFRYKLSFAPSGAREFQIGRRILNGPAYAALVARRQQAEPEWQPHPDYFPAYRA